MVLCMCVHMLVCDVMCVFDYLGSSSTAKTAKCCSVFSAAHVAAADQ